MQPGNHNPYGQPPQGSQQNPFASPPNPYAAPTPYADMGYDEPLVKEGTYIGGFLAGFLAALIGLILVYWLGKEETKRGALHGFLGRLGLVVVAVLLSALAG